MSTHESRSSTRKLMVTVAAIAVLCAHLAYLRAYLRSWEARRSIMYQQRDLTRSLIPEARRDVAVAAGSMLQFRNESDAKTYTSRWTERVDAWENRDGRNRRLLLTTVSGVNGAFSLLPIVIETYDDPSRVPWLSRLLRAYRANGWRYKVIRMSGNRRDPNGGP